MPMTLGVWFQVRVGLGPYVGQKSMTITTETRQSTPSILPLFNTDDISINSFLSARDYLGGQSV
jgi:hypothetical protein